MRNKNQSPESSALVKSADTPLTYDLPSPQTVGKMSVEEALSKRRTHRAYVGYSISAEDLSQILWAAYGITQPMNDYPQMRGGLRTAPSAGGTFPLDIYVMAGKVKGIDPGVYKYDSQHHRIVCVINKDLRDELCAAAVDQKMVRDAPASLIYVAVFSRSSQLYGDRGKERYVYMEAGHSAENVYLQAEALHLGTCSIGAFYDDRVKEVLKLAEEEQPLYIMPVGEYYYRKEF